MLVRLGLSGADSVPEGQRIVRTVASWRPPERGVRALPGAARSTGAGRPEHVYATVEPSREVAADARRAQQVCEAYRAAELIQPRPGLIIRVQA